MTTITYKVTVATGTTQYGTGNRFYINGELAPVLYLQEGNTYIFDQSDPSNAVGGVHQLAFSTTANGTHATPAGVAYTTGVTTSPLLPKVIFVLALIFNHLSDINLPLI